MTSKAQLIQYSRKLQHLPEAIVEALGEAFESGEYEEVQELCDEYKETKKKIKLAFFDKSVESVPELERGDDRQILQDVLLGEKLPFEKALEDSPLKGVLQDELNQEEMERLADDYFARGYGYVLGLYHAGALISRAGSLPDNLSVVLEEMRECYALERYLAVCMLCRTALEISVYHIYVSEELNDKKSSNYQFVKSNLSSGQRRQLKDIFDSENTYVEDYNPTLFDQMIMIGALPAYKSLNDSLHWLRQKTNSIVHSGRSVSAGESKQLITETLRVIHELYEV